MSANTSRLDRFLSGATGLSRRLAQQAIRGGEVQVQGLVSTDPGTHVNADTRVEFRGAVIAWPELQYWMLHKPVGVVCAARDSLHRTVIDCLNLPAHIELHVAGRLDIDATGLVLLTDDGAWLHRVTSPRHEYAKVYRVSLTDVLDDAGAERLRAGVILKDEPKPCQPAMLERLPGLEWRVAITEGKYHQVKRMFAALGNHVTALHRERIGAVSLDPSLAPGESRKLTAEEIASFT